MFDSNFPVLALPATARLHGKGLSSIHHEGSGIDSRSSTPRAHGHSSSGSKLDEASEFDQQQQEATAVASPLLDSEWAGSTLWTPLAPGSPGLAFPSPFAAAAASPCAATEQQEPCSSRAGHTSTSSSYHRSSPSSWPGVGSPLTGPVHRLSHSQYAGSAAPAYHLHHHHHLHHVHSRLDLHLQQHAGHRYDTAAAEAAANSCRRGTISTTKAVLADLTRASGSVAAPSGGFADVSILAALLASIRHQGQQLQQAAPGSPPQQQHQQPCGRLSSDGGSFCDSGRYSDGSDGSSSSSYGASSTWSEGDAGWAEVRLQRLLDCINTVTFLSHDAVNRTALYHLGAVAGLADLLPLSCPPAAAGEQQTVLAAALLRCIASLTKGMDAAKTAFWGSKGAPVALQLLAARQPNTAVLAAHTAVGSLAWGSSSSSSAEQEGVGSSSGAAGSGVLLQPRLLQALAAGLHPSTHPELLRLNLQQLQKAAALKDAGHLRGWWAVLFALVPLLVAPPDRQAAAPGYDARKQVLELLLALVECPETHEVVAAAGCLPPLLTLLLDDSSGRLGALAGCVLTSCVDSPACQQRLQEEPVLVALLQVLQQQRPYSNEAALAAAHLLRRLAQARGQEQGGGGGQVGLLLQAHGALPLLYRLLAADLDPDVRHVLVGLLGALGGAVRRVRRGHHCRHHHHSVAALAVPVAPAAQQ